MADVNDYLLQQLQQPAQPVDPSTGPAMAQMILQALGKPLGHAQNVMSQQGLPSQWPIDVGREAFGMFPGPTGAAGAPAGSLGMAGSKSKSGMFPPVIKERPSVYQKYEGEPLGGSKAVDEFRALREAQERKIIEDAAASRETLGSNNPTVGKREVLPPSLPPPSGPPPVLKRKDVPPVSKIQKRYEERVGEVSPYIESTFWDTYAAHSGDRAKIAKELGVTQKDVKMFERVIKKPE